jgi:hypothetical protein
MFLKSTSYPTVLFFPPISIQNTKNTKILYIHIESNTHVKRPSLHLIHTLPNLTNWLCQFDQFGYLRLDSLVQVRLVKVWQL